MRTAIVGPKDCVEVETRVRIKRGGRWGKWSKVTRHRGREVTVEAPTRPHIADVAEGRAWARQEYTGEFILRVTP